MQSIMDWLNSALGVSTPQKEILGNSPWFHQTIALIPWLFSKVLVYKWNIVIEGIHLSHS